MIISLAFSLNMCFECSKEPPHRAGLSTHNVCFGSEIRFFLKYTLIWRPDSVFEILECLLLFAVQNPKSC